MTEKAALHCSFCGKSQHEVRKLIAGLTGFICDRCVLSCLDVLVPAEGEKPDEPKTVTASELEAVVQAGIQKGLEAYDTRRPFPWLFRR